MILTFISFILLVIGGINWLCVGFFQFDFVAGIFGSQASLFSRAVYIIVGLATLYMIYAVIRYKGKLTMKRGYDELKEKMADNNSPTTKTNSQNHDFKM